MIKNWLLSLTVKQGYLIFQAQKNENHNGANP